METKVPELALPHDTTHVKKSSKKPAPSGGVGGGGGSSSGGGEGTVAGGPGPMMHPTMSTTLEVPRLNLSADPKNAGGGDPTAMAGEKTAKARAAKKASAPPPTGTTPPGTAGDPLATSSGPPTGSPADPAALAAIAKNDADRAAAARDAEAKREAKRQKQKEMEEAKKKEELQRRALEEARFQEEQRQREARIQQERAALRANAEECQEEDDYDDDFENYEAEEFEQDQPTVAPAQAKQPAAGAKATSKQVKPISNAEAAELKKIQEALQAERKELGAKSSSSQAPSSVKKPSEHDPFQTQSTGAGFSGASSSSAAVSRLAGLKQALDPRARRVKEILETRKFQSEKFHLFQLEPFTPLEWFGNRIRRGLLRQVACQTNDDAKQVAVQTKTKEKCDVSNQFPDDLGLSSSDIGRKKTKTLRASRFGGGKSKKKSAAPAKSLADATNPDPDRDEVDDYAPQEPEQDDEEDDDDDESNDFGSQSTVRFFRFLQQAGNVCELLVELNVAQHNEKMYQAQSKTGRKSSLENPFQGKRVVVGQQRNQDETKAMASREEKQTEQQQQQQQQEEQVKGRDDKPANSFWREVLANRTLVSMQFAPQTPHILLCSYGVAPEAEATSSSVSAMLTKSDSSRHLSPQMLTRRSVSCLWDLHQPDNPLFLLRNEGIITTSVLGPTRELFAIAGTEDGSLHVWDTREQAFLQETNVLVPSYSTCGMHDPGSSNHVSSIVSLQVIQNSDADRGSSSASQLKLSLANHSSSSISVFQFASLDDRGVFILWSVMEYPKGDEALFLDKCVEIGGRIKLVINAFIETHKAFPSAKSLASVGPLTTIFRFFPQDPNRFVVGTLTGQLAVLNRFETIQAKQAARMASKPQSCSVVAMDFHPFAFEFLLVGFSNGKISLYALPNLSKSVYDWPYECFTSAALGFVPSLSSVQWSTTASSVFFASFSNGQLMGWDLRHETSVSDPWSNAVT